eukprot:Tamp_12721.p1 GENE.Tamp_12721~~Tamp_12721.p1  ORF type:complete len:579 (+),score=117.45 Tamp_12721:82-1737(+)
MASRSAAERRVARRAVLALAAMMLVGAAAASTGNRVSFQGPFGSSGTVEGWTFMGSAVVTESFIRLTPAEAGHEGAVWSKHKMPFKEWEMEITFKVTGARYLGGDGFALWFTEKSEQFGATFGNAEDFVGLGVILDTYDNDGKRDNPAISAVVSKGDTKFDHDSDGREQRIPGAMCKINYRNPRNTVSMRVRYQAGVLFVGYDLRSRGSYTDCFRAQVELPASYYVGLTAHTGQVADNHDVFSVSTVSLDPQLPEPLPTQDPVQEEHQAHESVDQAHEWRKDDDRHLQRFADAVQRWSEMTEEARQRAREVRDEAERIANRGGNADADRDDDDDEDSSVRAPSAADAEREEETQRFRDEVSQTLNLIQSEVKQIAHEMRGTITLAHATPRASSEGEEGGGGGGSASELISTLGELVSRSQQSVTHEVSATHHVVRSDLEALRKDVADLQNSMRTHVLRNGQETTSKLSQVANDVSKMSQAISELQKRHDYHSKKLDQSHSQLKDHVISGGSTGGGFSLTVLLLSHLPWIGYMIYQSTKSKNKDLLLGGKYH